MALTLSSETEAKIRQRATREGKAPELLTDTLLQTALRQDETETRLARLREVLEGDENEQRETGEYLMNALKNHPLSLREFPE